MAKSTGPEKKGGDRPPRAPVTTDPRFATIHNDPRFAPPRRKDTKVKLDSRFKTVLTDDRFSSKTAVDRYGRAQEREAGRKELERFYDLEDDEDATSDSDKEDEEEGVKKPRFDPARGEGLVDATSSEDETSDEEEEEGEEDVDVEYEEGVAEGAATEVPTGEVTKRFAVVNLDWDHVRAVDLMKTLSSFGKVKKVAIYPSEFGKERMEREEMEGPPKEVFQGEKKGKKKEESESEESEVDEGDEEDENMGLLKEDKGEEFDSDKLRKYQLERLRYYYAVVECPTEKDAKAIYDNCDGAEYEATANFFDLRFIPADTTFDDDTPRDVCDREPTEYTPNEFVTDALQHSKVKLTWDEDDAQRKQVTKRAFTTKEIEDNELQAYLASSSDESEDEDKEAKKDKYRALLGGLTIGPDASAGNVEVTFTSGLTEDNGKVLQDEETDDEHLTTIEKYAKKEKARKAARKERARLAREAAAAANGEPIPKRKEEKEASPEPEADLGFDDPFFAEPKLTNKAVAKAEAKAKRKAEKQAAAEELAKRKAALEGVMGENNDDLNHFDMKAVIKTQKLAKLKKGKKKLAGKIEEDKVQADFKMDVKDPRFSAVFERHEFAIDPTNPRFVGTEGMREMMEERRRRGQEKGREEVDEDREGERKAKKRKNVDQKEELKSLVSSLKKKAKTAA